MSLWFHVWLNNFLPLFTYLLLPEALAVFVFLFWPNINASMQNDQSDAEEPSDVWQAQSIKDDEMDQAHISCVDCYVVIMRQVKGYLPADFPAR